MSILLHHQHHLRGLHLLLSVVDFGMTLQLILVTALIITCASLDCWPQLCPANSLSKHIQVASNHEVTTRLVRLELNDQRGSNESYLDAEKRDEEGNTIIATHVQFHHKLQIADNCFDRAPKDPSCRYEW